MELSQQVKAAVRSIEPQAEVVLFGSRVRGTAQVDSDWDFLILTEARSDLALKRKLWNAMYQLELQTGEVIHAVICEKNRWKSATHWPIHQSILQEGVAV